MSLIQSIPMSGHDPDATHKDVLTRVPTQRATRVAKVLPPGRVLDPQVPGITVHA
jgi:hypothetical protein